MGLPLVGAAEEVLKIKTEKGSFLVLSMNGHEHLGRMFDFEVSLAGALDMLGEPDKVDIHEMIGTVATVTAKPKQFERFYNGHVTRFSRGEKKGKYETFTMTLQPWLWFLTRTKTSRVFQAKSVQDVITEVFTGYAGVKSEWKLTTTYPKLDYCVQYNETDFDFVSRLMEEVGIYYFFAHEDGSHKLVLTDNMAAHESRGDSKKLKWANRMGEDDVVLQWTVEEEARSVKAVVTEYDYLAPSTAIEGKDAAEKPLKKPIGTMEWFEHPALVVQNSVKDAPTAAASEATARAKVRMEELVSLYASVGGKTNAQDFLPGAKFEIEDVPTPNDDDNGEYLIVSTVFFMAYAAHQAIPDLKQAPKQEGMSCEFIAMSATAPPFRSKRITAKPVIAGLQTAMVVGSSGNEIETDKHGRIRIHFHWDRTGKKDQTSSCWVRVAQPWAGKAFGAFSLPRIGQEVVVQFLDGDPDRPLVTGSVYNNENMPAWQLPKGGTLSGLKTKSTKEGTVDLANELRFEDEKGKEYIWFHAEKDFHRLVEKDSFDWVGQNESVKVVMTRKEVIGKDWLMDITNDVMHNIGKDLHVNVKGDVFLTGEATYQLQLKKDFSILIGEEGNLGIDVGGETHVKSGKGLFMESPKGDITLKAMNIVLEATAGLTLKVGGSTVDLKAAAVAIDGPMVKINGGGGGGSAKAASPKAPEKAKKEATIDPEKKDDYNKTFDDPLPKEQGGTGPVKQSP